MMSVPCGRMTLRPWFLIVIFLLDFSYPASLQDDVIGRLYGADLVPTATFLCAPIPTRLPGSVNTHGVNVGYTITLLIVLLTMAVDPTACDFEHRKFRPCKVLLSKDAECYFYCYCRQPLQPRYQILMLMFAVGVVEMLLLMAGDVERNPGPVVTELNPSDLVTVLTELLEAAAEWENIGLVLGLLPGTLNSIKGPHKPHKDCLRDMLIMWLNTSQTSWDSLIVSLKSPLIGMDNLASRLEQKYCSQQASCPLPDSSEVRKGQNRKLSAEDANEQRKQQLEAHSAMQATTDMELESPDMQIPNNRKRKLEIQGESGTRKEMCPAVAVHAVIPQPGVTAATPAHSQDPIDTYSSYLRRYYLRHNLPAYGKLPASPSKKYTRLASVLKENVTKQEADEFTRETIHGNIDDIAKKKTSITMEEIASIKDGVTPKFILVEGAPGIGKTTFAWEMCRKWSKGEVLQNYHLVLLLRLREEKVRGAKCTSDLFCYYKKDVKEQVVQRIEETGGRGVLLLFEGYDELPANSRTEESFFTDVIKGNELPEATVLVTSRPSATGFLYNKCRDYINQHIEILGFTSADIQSYLKDTCGENDSLLSGLQKYLQWYPHIRTMMYVPLNAGIVVEVYRTSKASNSVIPKTKTQLYQCLVCSLLRRYLSDHPVHGKKEWSIHSFEDLPEDVYKQFCKLARIADEGIRNNQQVIFNDLPEKFDTLGLMQCVPELYVDRGAVVSHSFPHLTIQEFMAAVHVSQGPEEKWQESFYTYSSNRRMVMRFLAGLTNLKGLALHFQEEEEDWFYMYHDHMKIDRFHWIFEAQIDYNGDAEEAGVNYREISSNFDWFVLGYCIAHSESTWTIQPDSFFLDIRDECVEGLVQGLLTHEGHFHGAISAVNLTHSHITSEGVKHLSRLPKHMLSSLEVLSLRNNPKIGEGCCAPLVEMLPATLVYLDLSDTGIGVEDCRALNKLLTSSSGLKTLDISENYLPPEAVELIFSGLQASTGVKGLKLSMGCSQQNCKSLASVLQNNNGTLSQLRLGSGLNTERSTSLVYELFGGDKESLYKYHLNLDFLQTSSAVHGSVTQYQSDCIPGIDTLHYVLGYCVSHASYTWEIQLGYEDFISNKEQAGIGNAEVEEFVHGVLDYETQPQSTILSLTIHHSNITSESVRQILKIPKHMLSSLKNLALTDSPGINEVGYTALNTLLESSATLETLDLTGNNLSPESVTTVLSGLQKSTVLRGLQLCITCSHFSQENCKLLALILQTKTVALKELQLGSTSRHPCQTALPLLGSRLRMGSSKRSRPSWGFKCSEVLRLNMTYHEATFNRHRLDLEFLQKSAVVICGSVTQYQSHHIPGVTSFPYVLGYCASHTTYTWDIRLDHSMDFIFNETEVGDTEVEEFVHGLLDCEAQPQSTITSLTIHNSRITSESIRQILKIPKHMLFSLEKLALTDSPGIDVLGYTALNTLLESSATLETLDLRGNHLSPESVAVVLRGLQKETVLRGVKLFMTCSQFSPENCQVLASVLQNNNGTFKQLMLESTSRHQFGEFEHSDRLRLNKAHHRETLGRDQLNFELLQEPSTAIHGSVTQLLQSDQIVARVSTWHFILGYCVSHTTYTWDIHLGKRDKEDSKFRSMRVQKIGDEDVEDFVCGLLDFEAQPQSTITSLTICYSKITSESIRQTLKIPKHMLSSLKNLALVGSPEIDVVGYTALNTLLESSSTLETLNLIGNSLTPEAVTVVLNGLQKSNTPRGIELFMTCSQFSMENCKLLASILKNSIGSLRMIRIFFYEYIEWYKQHNITLRVLPGPLTAIYGSVHYDTDLILCDLEEREKIVPQPGCTMWDYVLGYCISHTSHTWAIDLNGKFGDEEVENFKQGILAGQAQGQANISSLSLKSYNYQYAPPQLLNLTSVGVNQLLQLPVSISSLHVPSGVDELIPEIRKFQGPLVELRLGGTHGEIDSKDCQTLSELLASPSSLEILNIGYCGVSPRFAYTHSPEAVDLILSGLQKNTGLKEFSIGCSQFSQENCKSLLSVVRNKIRSSGSLRRLQVAMKVPEPANQRMELQFSPGPVVCGSVTGSSRKDTILCYALGYCVSHTACTWEITINSINTELTDEEVKAFADGVNYKYQPKSNITSLSLLIEYTQNTSVFQTLTSEGVKYILKLPKHMLSSLKTLSLRNNPRIGKGGCAPLVEKLPATLVHLDLCNTGIGLEDCRALNKLLTLSSALETLDISGNYLPPEAVELIFGGLQTATELKNVMIDYSQLSPKACQLLSSFHSLTLLSVNSCNIGPSETGKLVDALMCKDTLQCLISGNNPIGDEGADHLCRYLHHSNSLRTLDLSEWPVHVEWTLILSYKSSDLLGNSIGSKGAKTLTSILQQGHNTTLETLILPDRFSCWIPESLRSRVTTKRIELQKSNLNYLGWY